jgi:methylglutaconyl-CoA hydratase
VTLTKTLLYQIDGLGFDGAVEAAVDINALARQTDDCKKGIAAFLKRE